MPNTVLVDVHQLSRRFDALVWFVRLQRLEYDLNRFRCVIPISGPSTVETLPDSTAITSVLEGYTNAAPATLVPWHSQLDYQETLSSWQKRHSLQWTSSASISWILALSRPSWLAMAQIGLQDPLTTWQVQSAWLNLALGSMDTELLSLFKDEAYEPFHAQVYADYLAEGFRWCAKYHPHELPAFLSELKKRSFYAVLVSRLPPSLRSELLAHG